MIGFVTNGTMAGVFDEWNDDRSSVGWHEGCERTCDTSASSFSLGGLDASATSSQMRFQMAEDESGHRGCSEHIPTEFSDGAGDGRFSRDGMVNGFLVVELGNSKDTTRTDCSDL